ncbi:SHOCT domain-containing protein [Planococcus kocurii]|uniref:SHOCT domain-containing protein n=1 Tax=Planococcus kocurii TaxID=1374 RepID=UPI003CFE3033
MGEFFTAGNPVLGISIAVGFVVLLTAIGTALWFALIKARTKAASTEPNETIKAADLLRQSYVNGDITKEQYDEQLRNLQNPTKN